MEFAGAFAGPEVLLSMQGALRHRGPNDSGYYFEPGLGLCHTRLSIIDLSAQARQPMGKDGLRIIYNGEVYNYRAIRHTLQSQGHHFVSQSDTEVLLEAYRAKGTAAFKEFNGMFAFAIYDQPARKLILARDRMGIKPLVYFFDGKYFVFGSEIKVLREYPHVTARLSSGGLAEYLRLGYTAGEQTIWENCLRLMPGHYLVIDLSGGGIETFSYLAEKTPVEPVRSFSQAVDALDNVLQQEFTQSMVSDVPVGACISGGVDSNVLISVLAKKCEFKLKTFSLSTSDSVFDENKPAQQVARHLGLEHTSFYMPPEAGCSLWRETLDHYDEPLADQNILSFYYIARQAKQKGLSVLLTGLGGDELFFGYPHVTWRARLGRLYQIPYPVRRLVPREMFRFSNQLYKAIHLTQQKEYTGALANYLGNCFFDDEIDGLLARPVRPRPESYFTAVFNSPAAFGRSLAERITYSDLRTYLVHNGLAIADMSAMAQGVEMRVPYLNNGVTDLLRTIPFHFHHYQGEYKALLRAVERRYLPAECRMNVKKGFFPFVKKKWLDQHLKPAMDEFLSAEYLRKQGIFDPAAVKRLLGRHQHSRVKVDNKVWNLLTFQLWAKKHLERGGF